MDLFRFLIGAFTFVIDSIMGIMTSIILILFLICIIGALVECPRML
jgi:hypothetical protein